MTSRTHEVSGYNYSFDARAGGVGQLQLWGSLGKILDARFVDDGAPVPAAVPSASLDSAVAYYRRGSLPGLLDLLRGRGRVGVSIDASGPVSIRQLLGLGDSLVVCPTCAADLLAAKTTGLLEAMRRLVEFCGADAPPDICPITFHLSADGACGAYQPGVTTGYFGLDASGLGQVCLFDVEKLDRAPPFTVANASTRQDQLLAVHEAMHGWFVGRQTNYRVQEPFCKWLSFYISETPPPPCAWFVATPDEHPDALMKYLCGMGMNTTIMQQILARLARAALAAGRPLSDAEFAGLVSEVFGRDATPAFRSAGILP